MLTQTPTAAGRIGPSGFTTHIVRPARDGAISTQPGSVSNYRPLFQGSLLPRLNPSEDHGKKSPSPGPPETGTPAAPPTAHPGLDPRGGRVCALARRPAWGIPFPLPPTSISTQGRCSPPETRPVRTRGTGASRDNLRVWGRAPGRKRAQNCP